MFSRSKTSDHQTANSPTPPIPQKRGSGRTAPSIISNDLVVNGDLTAAGDIQIDGTVEGDVRSQSLTVGEKASITGQVVAEDVVLRGRVIGSVRGRRVQLASTCHVQGDIIHETLAVETGAFFEGNCRHSDDPLNQSSDKKSIPARPTPTLPKGAPGASPVVVKDGGVVVKRPAAQ